MIAAVRPADTLPKGEVSFPILGIGRAFGTEGLEPSRLLRCQTGGFRPFGRGRTRLHSPPVSTPFPPRSDGLRLYTCAPRFFAHPDCSRGQARGVLIAKLYLVIVHHFQALELQV